MRTETESSNIKSEYIYIKKSNREMIDTRNQLQQKRVNSVIVIIDCYLRFRITKGIYIYNLNTAQLQKSGLVIIHSIP